MRDYLHVHIGFVKDRSLLLGRDRSNNKTTTTRSHRGWKMNTVKLTLDIEKETLSNGEEIYVAVFREVEVASQGSTIEEAQKNAVEAMNLFLNTASHSELERRLPVNRSSGSGVFTTQLEIPYGQTQGLIGI